MRYYIHNSRAIELDENPYRGYKGLGVNLAGLKKYTEAIEALKTAVSLSSRQPLPLVELCWIYSLSGNEYEIQNISDELTTRSKTEYISGVFMSCVAYYSKQFDNAIEYLENAFNQRDCTPVGIKAYPISAFMRTDPNFQPFITRMNYPES